MDSNNLVDLLLNTGEKMSEEELLECIQVLTGTEGEIPRVSSNNDSTSTLSDEEKCEDATEDSMPISSIRQEILSRLPTTISVQEFASELLGFAD
jgi:hypothetical protein